MLDSGCGVGVFNNLRCRLDLESRRCLGAPPNLELWPLVFRRDRPTPGSFAVGIQVLNHVKQGFFPFRVLKLEFGGAIRTGHALFAIRDALFEVGAALTISFNVPGKDLPE